MFPHTRRPAGSNPLVDITGDWYIESPELLAGSFEFYLGHEPVIDNSCVKRLLRSMLPRAIKLIASSYKRDGATRFRIGFAQSGSHLAWSTKSGRLGTFANPMYKGLSEWLQTVPTIASLRRRQSGYVWVSAEPVSRALI